MLFYSASCILVGNKGRTSLWIGWWIGHAPLAQLLASLFSICCNPRARIKDNWDVVSRWSITFRRNLKKEEFIALSNLLTLLEDQRWLENKEDKMVWLPCSKSIFTVKSMVSPITRERVDISWHNDA